MGHFVQQATCMFAQAGARAESIFLCALPSAQSTVAGRVVPRLRRGAAPDTGHPRRRRRSQSRGRPLADAGVQPASARAAATPRGRPMAPAASSAWPEPRQAASTPTTKTLHRAVGKASRSKSPAARRAFIQLIQGGLGSGSETERKTPRPRRGVTTDRVGTDDAAVATTDPYQTAPNVTAADLHSIAAAAVGFSSATAGTEHSAKVPTESGEKRRIEHAVSFAGEGETVEPTGHVAASVADNSVRDVVAGIAKQVLSTPGLDAQLLGRKFQAAVATGDLERLCGVVAAAIASLAWRQFAEELEEPSDDFPKRAAVYEALCSWGGPHDPSTGVRSPATPVAHCGASAAPRRTRPTRTSSPMRPGPAERATGAPASRVQSDPPPPGQGALLVQVCGWNTELADLAAGRHWPDIASWFTIRAGAFPPHSCALPLPERWNFQDNGVLGALARFGGPEAAREIQIFGPHGALAELYLPMLHQPVLAIEPHWQAHRRLHQLRARIWSALQVSLTCVTMDGAKVLPKQDPAWSPHPFGTTKADAKQFWRFDVPPESWEADTLLGSDRRETARAAGALLGAAWTLGVIDEKAPGIWPDSTEPWWTQLGMWTATGSGEDFVPAHQQKSNAYPLPVEQRWQEWGRVHLAEAPLARRWIFSTICGRPRPASLLSGRIVPVEVAQIAGFGCGLFHVEAEIDGRPARVNPNILHAQPIVARGQLRARIRRGLCLGHMAGACPFDGLPGQRSPWCHLVHQELSWGPCTWQLERDIRDEGQPQVRHSLDPGVGRIHSTLLHISTPTDRGDGRPLGYELGDASADLFRDMLYTAPQPRRAASRRGHDDGTTYAKRYVVRRVAGTEARA